MINSLKPATKRSADISTSYGSNTVIYKKFAYHRTYHKCLWKIIFTGLKSYNTKFELDRKNVTKYIFYRDVPPNVGSPNLVCFLPCLRIDPTKGQSSVDDLDHKYKTSSQDAYRLESKNECRLVYWFWEINVAVQRNNNGDLKFIKIWRLLFPISEYQWKPTFLFNEEKQKKFFDKLL